MSLHNVIRYGCVGVTWLSRHQFIRKESEPDPGYIYECIYVISLPIFLFFFHFINIKYFFTRYWLIIYKTNYFGKIKLKLKGETMNDLRSLELHLSNGRISFHNKKHPIRDELKKNRLQNPD